MSSGPEHRSFLWNLFGGFLLPILTSCSGDGPTSESSVQAAQRKTGYEIIVSDQHHNRVAHDTVAVFAEESLDSLGEGVYRVVTKRLSDSKLEFRTVVVGGASWMRNGVGALGGVEIDDFFCVLTSAGMPIIGYCEQVTGVLRFATDPRGDRNGAVWTRCAFEVREEGSLHLAKPDRSCSSSLRSAYQGIDYFGKLFGDGSSVRVVANDSGILIGNDSMSVGWSHR